MCDDFRDKFAHIFVRKEDRGHEKQSQRQQQNSPASRFQTRDQLSKTFQAHVQQQNHKQSWIIIGIPPQKLTG